MLDLMYTHHGNAGKINYTCIAMMPLRNISVKWKKKDKENYWEFLKVMWTGEQSEHKCNTKDI